MSKIVIIYTNKDNKSIIAAAECKEKNPKAIMVESSDGKALSKALSGAGNKVHCFDKKVDKRHLKADKVVKTKTKAKAKAKKVVTKGDVVKKSITKKKKTSKKKK